MSNPSRTSSSPSPFATLLIAVIVCGILAAILFPVHAGGGPSIGSACASNLKQLALANLMYAPENNDRFPNRDSWMDAIQPYVRNHKILHCPQLQKDKKDENVFGYAFHGLLSSSRIPKQPETVPLVFESMNLAKNASGTLVSLPKPGRHEGGGKHGNFVTYADGHLSRLE